MKNKTSRVLLNGVLLSAMAAVGLTAYQLITTPLGDSVITEEMQIERDAEMEKEPEEPLSVDAGTDYVTAQIEKMLEKQEEKKKTDAEVKREEKAEETENENEISAETESMETIAEETENPLEDTAAETVSMNVSVPVPHAAYLEFSENTPMEWPVHGNIVLDYDMDQTTYFPTLDQYRTNPAISVSALEGTPVTAAVDGVVYQISESPRTGTTVVMELGKGYQAIYGQLKDLTIYEGEVIEKGDTIGYVSSPTKYYSEEGSNLYFAMKKDGQPIDPILYLP